MPQHPIAAWMSKQNPPLTQRAFCVKFGISFSSLCRVLKGERRRLNLEACRDISKATGIPLEQLLAIPESKPRRKRAA